jgi:predicted MFS family arabinose efflux permease
VVLYQAFGWRMIFYINVPVAIGAMLLARRVLPPLEGRGTRERFDVAGAVTFGTGLGTLLLGASLGPVHGWRTPVVDMLLVTGAALLTAFFLIERRVRPPMLELSLFRDQAFTGANAAKLCAYAASFTVVLVVPFYLQQVLHYSIGTVGVALAPMPVALATGSLVGGPLSDRVGSHVLAPLGVAVAAVGGYLFMLATPERGYVMLAAAMAVMDFGMGLFIAPNDAVIMNSAPPNRQGVAGGVLALMRSAGMIAGLTLAATIVQSHLSAAVGGSLMSGGAPGPVALRALANGIQSVYVATVVLCLFSVALSLLRGPAARRGR